MRSTSLNWKDPPKNSISIEKFFHYDLEKKAIKKTGNEDAQLK
jgi:hypothetical protein